MNIYKIYFLSLAACFLSSPLLSITILIHGTFAKNELWHQPDGDFYKTYAEIASQDRIYSFTWSGKLSHEARLEAAHNLSKKIISYYSDDITVIAHSHGGNVMNLASHLLEAAWHSVQNAYQGPALHKINAMLKLFIPEPCFVKYDFPFSYTRKLIEELDTQEELKQLIHDKVRALYDQIIEIGDEIRFVKKKYVIRRAQYLAVPVMLANYSPNMQIIEKLEHYYAENDWIQLLGGIGEHQYQQHPRITQIKLLFAESIHSKNHYDADHYSIHHSLVAHWLAQKEAIDLLCHPGEKYSLVLNRDLSRPLVSQSNVN